MRKLKLIVAACALMGTGQAWAQTDVTSTYITNADFSQGTPVSSHVYGYAHDALKITDTTHYGLQTITGWTAEATGVTDGDDPAKGTENVAAMGAIFEYGSEYQMKGNNTIPPSAGPDGEAGTCLGIAGVWGANAQYYQEVTLTAGKYVFTVTYYSKSGTQANTSLFGFIEDGGTSHVVPCNPATGNWKTESVSFTLLESTSGKISVGYKSTGNGSGANPHLYVDNIKLTREEITAPTLPLRADFGGSTVDLSDFVVGNGDYTLEVEGTVGTAINIAADNISYTPTTSGNVRFVKYDGVVYVYEDGFFTKAVASSKASVTFTDITETNVTTSESNLLANPSFETLGSSIGTDIYNIGTPWTSNVTMKSGGIRVGKNGSAANGEYVLVWRGSGNNNYITQPLTTLKPLHQYQVKMQQVASGNANANFNVGIGSAAGEYSLASTTVKLGTSNDGTKTISFDTPSNIVEGDTYYFTFRNTSNNTASSGSDPVTQIDWMSLVCQDALTITGATSAVYLDGTAYAPTSAKEAYEALLEEAEATIANDDYANVTGSERTDLQAAIDAEVADNKDAYNAATLTLSTALDAFTDALTHYQALIDAQAAVPDLAYASTSASAFKTAVATSADDADTKLAAMTTNIRAYYESHALAEGVDGAVNMTSSITNANNPTNNDGWTWTGNKNNPASNEPWTDADGTNTHSYFDGGNWNGSNWTTTMEQTITVPAGKYLLTAKGRAATNTTLTMAVGEKSVELPHVGSTGNVFDRGWGDASLEFVSDGKAITIKVTATASPTHEWFSISDFRLVQLEYNNDAYTTDFTALNAAITAAATRLDAVTTLGFEEGQYAPYNVALLKEAKAAAEAIDQEATDNLKTDIDAITEALTNATTACAANTEDVDAIYNGTFAVANGTNPKGWSRTNNGWGQQVTNISDEATAWYYNNNSDMVYGETGDYTMPLAANTVYKVTFKYCSHEGTSNNGMTLSVLNADEEGLASTSFPASGTQHVWATGTKYFKTGAAGNYVLKLGNNGNSYMTGVSLTKAVAETVTLDEDEEYTPAETYANVTLTRNFTANVWNTFVVPFDIDNATLTSVFGAEVQVAEATLSSDAVKFSTMETPAITANKPVIIKGVSEAAPYAFSGVLLKNATPTITDNGTSFIGTYATRTLAEGEYYIAANQLKVANGTQTIKGFRAYFTTTSSARLTFFVDGEATAIEGISAESQLNGKVYNLSGQQVEKAQKGIYVKNGKKVVIK